MVRVRAMITKVMMERGLHRQQEEMSSGVYLEGGSVLC